MIEILKNDNTVFLRTDTLIKDLRNYIDTISKNLSGVVFVGMNLQSIDFSGCVFNDTILMDCDLSKCSFTDALFTDCIIDNCKLNNVVGDGTVIKNLQITNHLCTLYCDTLAIGCKQYTVDKWNTLSKRMTSETATVTPSDIDALKQFVKDNECHLL